MAESAARNGIPTRILGNTGERVTIMGIGGYHIGITRDEQKGVRIVRSGIDEGINFLDNAWCYNDGESERIMGSALRNGYRNKVFLMTKNHGRDPATFRKQLDESLARLQTDHIDLLQCHEIIYNGIPEQIHKNNVFEEAEKARDAGKIRFIGFTGHRWPHLFQQMLAGSLPWDTLQMPVNLLDYHFRSFAREILPIAVEREMGIIGMKSLGGTGAQLLQAGVSDAEAITYTLSQPIHVLVVGIDTMELLHRNLAVVRSFHQLSQADQKRLLDRVKPWAIDGALERCKTG